jgi:hypothetical protein
MSDSSLNRFSSLAEQDEKEDMDVTSTGKTEDNNLSTSSLSSNSQSGSTKQTICRCPKKPKSNSSSMPDTFSNFNQALREHAQALTSIEPPFGRGGGINAKSPVKFKSSLALANTNTLTTAFHSAGQSISSTKTTVTGTTNSIKSALKTPNQMDIPTPSSENSGIKGKITSASSTLLVATFYTFHAQLTFHLSPTTLGINVAEHFNTWATAPFKVLPQITLLPFKEENGTQITSSSQIQDDKAVYSTYFHNHRVL